MFRGGSLFGAAEASGTGLRMPPTDRLRANHAEGRLGARGLLARRLRTVEEFSVRFWFVGFACFGVILMVRVPEWNIRRSASRWGHDAEKERAGKHCK